MITFDLRPIDDGQYPPRASKGKRVHPHGPQYGSKLARRIVRARRDTYRCKLERHFAKKRPRRKSKASGE